MKIKIYVWTPWSWKKYLKRVSIYIVGSIQQCYRGLRLNYLKKMSQMWWSSVGSILQQTIVVCVWTTWKRYLKCGGPVKRNWAIASQIVVG